MTPEIFVLISTVCFPLSNGVTIERVCRQMLEITTTPVTAKEGQTVKRLCDFVDHRWKDENIMYLDTKRNRFAQVAVCIFCHKKRLKVTTETWEDVEPEQESHTHKWVDGYLSDAWGDGLAKIYGQRCSCGVKRHKVSGEWREIR